MEALIYITCWYDLLYTHNTAQKTKLFIKDFYRQMWPDPQFFLLKKSLIKNFIFGAV